MRVNWSIDTYAAFASFLQSFLPEIKFHFKKLVILFFGYFMREFLYILFFGLLCLIFPLPDKIEYSTCILDDQWPDSACIPDKGSAMANENGCFRVNSTVEKYHFMERG